MTDEKNTQDDLYKGVLVKALNTKENTVFYGVLKNRDSRNIILLPYLAYEPNSNGQNYPVWITEGLPLELRRERISAIHPTNQENINLVISNGKRVSDINAQRLRLEEIASEMELSEKVEAYQKKKRQEQDQK